jgi:hypothetical protein
MPYRPGDADVPARRDRAGQGVLDQRAVAGTAEAGHRGGADERERRAPVTGDERPVVGGRVVGDPQQA